MSRPQDLLQELHQYSTIANLTSVFENLASSRIAQIKTQVQQSEHYFEELWQIYKQLQVEDIARAGRQLMGSDKSDKELFIVVTAEGGFSGDIDEKLIEWMLTHYDKEKHDIVVIGHHGAIQLAQRGVSIKRYYKMPTRDTNINVYPIIADTQHYRRSTAFYQTYVSLMVQDVKRLELLSAILARGKDVKTKRELITEETYIFEPDPKAVAAHLERSMMHIAMSQVILESKLAQYASRFRAMTAANEKATEAVHDLRLSYNRSRRALGDERLKEIMNGLKKARAYI